MIPASNQLAPVWEIGAFRESTGSEYFRPIVEETLECVVSIGKCLESLAFSALVVALAAGGALKARTAALMTNEEEFEALRNTRGARLRRTHGYDRKRTIHQ